MGALGDYAQALGTTIAVEAALYACFGLRRELGWVLLAALLVNLASHPAATALLAFAAVPWLAAEALVVVFEAAALRAALGWSRSRAAAAALCANGATAAIALLEHAR